MKKYFSPRFFLFFIILFFFFDVCRSQDIGNISPSSQTLFSGSNPSTISIGGPDISGYTYQWMRSSNGTDFYFISGATSTYYTPPGPETQTFYYRVYFTSTTNGSHYNSPISAVIIKDHLAVGTVTPASATINYNTSPGILTSSGATGGIGTYAYQWQQSSDNATFVDISGATSQNYTPGALTATTYFRQKTVCGTETAYSNVVTINVYAQLAGGTIAPVSQSINYNTSAANLTASTVSGGNGTYTYQWQKSPDNSSWSNISGATTLVYSPGALTATTYYRLNTTSNGASLISNTAVVNVYPQLVAGNVTPVNQSINYNTTANLAGVAPTGGSGVYTYQWQSSANGTTWSNITGATNLAYTTSSLTTTTYYRLVYTSNGISVNSNTATITVYPQVNCNITWSGSVINYNTSPGIISNTPSGGNGSYSYQWQQSVNNATWTNISGATGKDYTPGLQTDTIWFRVITTSNGVSSTSNVIVVNVYAQLLPGSITPSSGNVASGSSPGVLTGSLPSGGSGSYTYQWQSSVNSGSTWSNISGATSQNYTPPSLTASTWIRRAVTSNSVTAYTAAATFNVFPALIVPTIANSFFEVYFYGAYNITIASAIGGTGTYSYQWQSSSDSINWSNITGATGLSYTPKGLTSTTYFRMKVLSGTFTGYSNIVTALLPLNGGIISINLALINSGGSVSLAGSQVASGSACSSYTYQWQSSQDGFNWNSLAGTTVSGITRSTYFRRLASCGSKTVSSNVVQVKVINTSAQLVPTTETAPPAGTQTNISMPLYAGIDPNNLNYIRTRLIRKPGLTAKANADLLTAATDVSQTTVYFDGLGRPIQTVTKQATPDLGDLIRNDFYDAYGRESVSFLPYTDSAGTGAFRTNSNVKQPNFYNSFFSGIEGYYYSNTVFENSPLNRVLKTTSPGKSWSGSNVGRSRVERVNTVGDSVVIWGVSVDSSSLPYKTGYYLPGTLYVTEDVDENGNRTVEYKTMEGSLVLRKVQNSDFLLPSHTGWLCSYYLYDVLGRLRFVIPPKAVELVKNNWIITDSIASGLCYQYRYDKLSRMVVKKQPGTDSTEMIYDKRDRLIAVRDGYLKSIGYWRVYYYDTQNREKIEGLYYSTIARNSLLDSIQSYTYNPSNSLPFIDTANIYKLVYTFYDDYNYQGALSFVSTDISKPQAGSNFYSETIPSSGSKLIRGKVTGVRAQIDYSGQFLMTTSYFDDKSRTVQTIEENMPGGKDISTFMYDFNGNLLSSYLNHTNPRSAITPQTSVLTQNHYNSIGLIDTITRQLNDNPNLKKTIAVKNYDVFSRISSKKLDNLEILNYSYNIQGWLNGINKQYVNTYGSTSNWFGEELSYDYGFDLKQSNGVISGVKWKGRGTGISRSYGYDYDNCYRLKTANFNQQNYGSTSWTKDKADFSSKNRYDENGNILSMWQMGLNGVSVQVIDSLIYGYLPYSNKLNYVTDKKNNVQSILGDFKEIVNDTSNDYLYNASGNLLADKNKNIDTIIYNHVGKLSVIEDKHRGKIFYQYLGGADKVTEIVIDTTQAHPRYLLTHYIGDFVYENDTLRYIKTEEGRIRLAYRTGMPVSYAYDYFVQDHLGNIRTVLSNRTDTAIYAATMESAATSVEESLFNNLSNTRAPLPNPYPTDNTTNPNQYCALLNASTNKVGPGLALRVMAGDTISIATKGLYKNAGANTSSSTSSAMSAAIIQAFSGSGITDGVHSGIGTGSPISSFTSSIYSNLVTKDPNQNLSGSPKAYLNYASFDDQFNLVDENSGVKQLQGPIDSLNILSVGKFRVNRTGFIYIYLTNESAQNVYFDNLIVSHISGPLLEETHYYPFGLTMAGISSGALKGPLYPENKKKFQAQDFDDNFGLNIYQFKWRDHDPQIGRFWEVDPLADKYVYNSPYAFSENKVTSNTELEGLEVAADMRVERDLRDVSSGKITAKELNARFEARAGGDLLGVAAAGVAAFSLLQPQAAQVLYASMLFGAPSPGSPTSVAASVATESAAVASEATSAAAPEANAVTTTASEAATATEAAASGASGTAASNAERIQARVQAFKEAIPKGIQRDKTVTAVATGTDASGNNVTLVGSSTGKLNPYQINAMQPGEIGVTGSETLHAEINVLNHAKASGITLQEIGATKPVCANCATAIDNTGVKIVTPLKEYSPKALKKVIANPPPSNSSIQGRLFN